MQPLTLSLYMTDCCHLCDLAKVVLTTTLNPEYFSVSLCDIALDDALVERYGTRIPVLVVAVDGRELGWPFDAAELMQFLDRY